MLHPVVGEMPEIEGVGEIIEICQRVGDLELARLFRHATPFNFIYRLTSTDTVIVYLLVSTTWRSSCLSTQQRSVPASSTAGLWLRPPLRSPSSASAALTHSAPFSSSSCTISALHAAPCRWCFRSPV